MKQYNEYSWTSNYACGQPAPATLTADCAELDLHVAADTPAGLQAAMEAAYQAKCSQ